MPGASMQHSAPRPPRRPGGFLVRRPTTRLEGRREEDADAHRLPQSARPLAAAAPASLRDVNQDQQEERPPVEADGRSNIHASHRSPGR